MGTLFQLIFVFHLFQIINCDYDCLCTYSVETRVLNKASLSSSVYGNLYEFDCKPVYFGNSQDYIGFYAVQFNHKVVYVEKSNSVLVQICQGSVPLTDRATLLPDQLKTTSPSTNSYSSTITQTTPKGSNTVTRQNLSSLSWSAILKSTRGQTNTVISSGTTTRGPGIYASINTTSSKPVSVTMSNGLKTTENETWSVVSFPPTTASSDKSSSSITYMSPTSTQKLQTNSSTTITTRAASVKQPNCPVGWTLFQNSCYKFHTSQRNTWEQANRDCAAQQAHLVFIESSTEENFLKTYLSRHLDLHIDDNSDTGTWIGARDNAGSWVWRDSYTQTDIQIGYSHWRHGQPDSDSQDCAAMIGRQGFEWMDYECSQLMFHVCEKPLIDTKTNLNGTRGPIDVLGDCESGWTAHQNSCYRFITEQGRLEWSPAYKFCETMGSHLVIIDTAEEDRFVREQMQTRINTDNDDDEETGVWTAGTDQDVEDRWVWRNSLRHTDTPISGYKNWYPGEPDSGDHEKEEDCLCLIGNKGFQWQDYRCRDNMYFICEKPRSASVVSSFIG